MSGSARDISKLDIDARLSNLEVRSRCGGDPVCPGMSIPDFCDETLKSTESRCLVRYHYPMSVAEVAAVAEEADYVSQMEESDRVAAAAAREFEKQQPKAPFKPDWRFWTGITLSGVGLFLYRNR